MDLHENGNRKELDRIRTEVGIILVYSVKQLEEQRQKVARLDKQMAQLFTQKQKLEAKEAQQAAAVEKLRRKARHLTEMIGDSWQMPEAEQA